jgi:hypothetical protein
MSSNIAMHRQTNLGFFPLESSGIVMPRRRKEQIQDHKMSNRPETDILQD